MHQNPDTVTVLAEALHALAQRRHEMSAEQLIKQPVITLTLMDKGYYPLGLLTWLSRRGPHMDDPSGKGAQYEDKNCKGDHLAESNTTQARKWPVRLGKMR